MERRVKRVFRVCEIRAAAGVHRCWLALARQAG